MGVTFIYGKAGTGKSMRVFQDIKEKMKTGKKIYLITPEQFSFTAERKLLDVLNVDAIIQAEVLTFNRMAYRLIRESKEQEKQHLTPSGKAMIIASILQDEKKNLKFLGKSNENIELIQKQIKEFKKHGVTVTDLEEVLEKEENPYLKAKITDILTVYQKYEKRIEKEYIDDDDLLSILLTKLEDNHEFDGAYIYIDEFVGFTKQEYLIISKLMEKASGIAITICTDTVNDSYLDETDLFFENKKTYARLIELAYEKKIEDIEYIETNRNKFVSTELKHLSNNIYAVPYHIYTEKVEDLSLFLASNAYTEVEHVAKEIRRLVKEKNYRYKDIAIITKDLESYGNLCNVVFRQYKIPFFIDEKRDLSQNILIKYLISILDIFSKNWSFETVLSYIKMDFLELEDDEIYRLEEYASKWGIKGAKWYQGNWKMPKDQKEPEKILRARENAIQPLARLKEKLVRKNAKEISAELYQFLIEQKIDQKIEKKRKELEEKGLFDIANEYQNSWKILMELFDELVFLFGDEKIGLERYMGLLKVGMQNRCLGKIPAAQDQVTIGDVDRSKSHTIKAIFIIGLNDGVFPTVYQSEGFFDDEDRKILKNHKIELAKGTKERLYEDRFNLYKAFSIAEEKIFLSYVSSNLEGATLRPSIFVGKIKRIFKELREESDIVERKSEITTENVTFDELLLQIDNWVNGGILTDEWVILLEYYQNHPEWKERLENALNGIFYSNLPENIKKENLDKLYGDTIHTSVSKLEQYSSCAFSYYLKYALGLKEKEQAKVQSVDTGVFLHDLISHFFEYIRQEKIQLKEITEKDIEQNINELIKEKLNLDKNEIFNLNKKYQFLVIRLRKLLKTALLHIIESLKYSDFEILGNEIEFKKRKKLSTNSNQIR